MKRTLFITLFTFLGFISNAQKEADTTRFKLGKSTVIVINSAPDSLDYNFDFTTGEGSCKKSEDKHQGTQFIIDVGTNGYLNSEGDLELESEDRLMELNYGRSRSIGISFLGDVATLKKDRIFFATGLGFTSNGYHFENNINISNNNDYTEFTLDTILNNSKYKLRVNYLEIPLMLRAQFGSLKKPFGIQFGLIAGFRVGSIVKQKHNIDGADHKNRIADNYNINPYKLDYIFRLTFSNVGLFGRYSTATLFEKDKAAAVYPFSLGITIGGFM